MNYILGFLPDEKSRFQIGKVIGELGGVFDGQDVNVRWMKPNSYHITLVYLGEKINFLSKFMLGRRIKKTQMDRFSIKLEKANVGIHKNFRELVYTSLASGGDEIRNILYSLGLWKVRTKDFEVFIPHMTLGRISKVLSDEEYRNLVIDVRNINKQLDINEIQFEVKELCLLKFDEGKMEIIEKYPLR